MTQPSIKVDAHFKDGSTREIDFDVDRYLSNYLQPTTTFYYITIDGKLWNVKKRFYKSRTIALNALVEHLRSCGGWGSSTFYMHQKLRKDYPDLSVISAEELVNRLMDEGRLEIKSIIL